MRVMTLCFATRGVSSALTFRFPSRNAELCMKPDYFRIKEGDKNHEGDSGWSGPFDLLESRASSTLPCAPFLSGLRDAHYSILVVCCVVKTLYPPVGALISKLSVPDTIFVDCEFYWTHWPGACTLVGYLLMDSS